MNISIRLISVSLLYTMFLQLVLSFSGMAYKPESIEEQINDMPLIVSMGDSYSSGEGNEPFYDQDFPIAKKSNYQDWLAHRSEKAWGGLLAWSITDDAGEVSIVQCKEVRNVRWFFVASSGATTQDFCNKQSKTVAIGEDEVTRYIEPQINVFSDNDLYGKVDYVTLTLGGNDVGFVDIVTKAAKASFCILDIDSLEYKLDEALVLFHLSTKYDLMQTFELIHAEAGEQAKIIVVGYPPLIDDTRSTKFFGQVEAEMINNKIIEFNNGISEAVDEYSKSNSNVKFIPIYTYFDGHEAYSKNPYINGIMFTQSEDLNKLQKSEIENRDFDSFPEVISAYSIHPNEAGHMEIAKLVQEYIDDDYNGQSHASVETQITEETSSEETVVTTETTTTGMDMKVVYSAYTDVLRDYESEMRSIENSEWGATDTCALTDVTGDGYPELIILYVAEGEYGSYNWFSADVCVYTVFPGETSATNILHLPEITHFTSAGMACSDVVLLSNGNILVETADGDEDWFVSYFEYAFDGHSYNLICTTEDNYYAYSHEDYLINGESVSEETFNKKIEEYKSMFSSVLTMSPFYNYDYASDWAIAVLDTPNNIMSFDEAWALMSSSESTESVIDEASVNLGVYNYISSWYDWDTAYAREEEYGSDAAGWGPDTSYVDGMYVTAFQSYTGAVLYYYTDPLTGYTYETEYGAFNGYEETKTGVDFYIQDYLV